MSEMDAPPTRALEWVAASVAATARVVRVQSLAGGGWHATHLVTVRWPGDSDLELVLRRWTRPGWMEEDPELTPGHEAAVLELVSPASVPTPRLINCDLTGTNCDVPAILTDRLPGRPPGLVQASESFLRQLAEASAAIHSVPIDDQARLPSYTRYHPDLAEGGPPTWSSQRATWEGAAHIAARAAPPGSSSLIHRDYHPGNTLWLGGKLTGVVDWTQGCWGPVAVDTAHLRWNLAVRHGIGAADRFLEYARRLSPTGIEEQRYWDVVTVLDLVPDLQPETWSAAKLRRLEGYLEGVLADSGRGDRTDSGRGPDGPWVGG